MLQSWDSPLVRYPFFISLFAFFQMITGSYHERRLYDDLMRNYNSLERPVQNHSQPVVVSFHAIFVVRERYRPFIVLNSLFCKYILLMFVLIDMPDQASIYHLISLLFHMNYLLLNELFTDFISNTIN